MAVTIKFHEMSICDVIGQSAEDGPPSWQALANAKLIAAAPELLEAAQYAVECLDRMWNQFNNIGDDGDQAYQSLKAAIKKATE